MGEWGPWDPPGHEVWREGLRGASLETEGPRFFWPFIWAQGYSFGRPLWCVAMLLLVLGWRPCAPAAFLSYTHAALPLLEGGGSGGLGAAW